MNYAFFFAAALTAGLIPGMITVPSGSRVSGLILMADMVWLLVSRYSK